MNVLKRRNIMHKLFVVGVGIKAVDGLLELVGGFFLILFSTNQITTFIQNLFAQELTHDPADILANFFINTWQNISTSALSFAAAYLIVHGILKLVLSFGLLMKNVWIYLGASIVLFIFVVYQVVRVILNHSIWLAIFTLIDIIILTLIRSEYVRIRNEKSS